MKKRVNNGTAVSVTSHCASRPSKTEDKCMFALVNPITGETTYLMDDVRMSAKEWAPIMKKGGYTLEEFLDCVREFFYQPTEYHMQLCEKIWEES